MPLSILKAWEIIKVQDYLCIAYALSSSVSSPTMQVLIYVVLSALVPALVVGFCSSAGSTTGTCSITDLKTNPVERGQHIKPLQ